MNEELKKLLEAAEALKAYAEAASNAPASTPPVPVPAAPTATATAVPAVTQGIEDQAAPEPTQHDALLSIAERDQVEQVLRGLSTPALYKLFAQQAIKQGHGVNAEAWLAAGGPALVDRAAMDPTLSKALDSTGGAALIRQDLEPVLRELFVRSFPAYDRFAKEPSNGLVHTYQQMTDFGGAQWMPELGTVTDDKSTYVRKTTNIGVIATRRGVSLKAMYATAQSGSGFNPGNTELRGGLLSIVAGIQTAIFHGNADATNSDGTDADEKGAYDENAFTGLRSLLSDRTVNVDPFASTPEDIRAAIDLAAVQMGDSGGVATILYGSYPTKRLWDIQQDKNLLIRPQEQVDLAVGVRVAGANTTFGLLPFVGVPGPYVGTYAISGPQTVGDIYMLDENQISLPWLGTEGPTVLEIPIGVNGQLSRSWIIFQMLGMAVKALGAESDSKRFQNKVRVYQD